MKQGPAVTTVGPKFLDAVYLFWGKMPNVGMPLLSFKVRKLE